MHKHSSNDTIYLTLSHTSILEENIKDDKAVYENYRASLRSQRKKDSGSGRTSARKQIALKVTADRYSIPMSAVKAIVRSEDAKAGLTHEHTEAYKLELAFGTAFAAAQAKLGESPCSHCNLAYESKLVRPRFANKLDSGELFMESTLARYELVALRFVGTPKVEDFIQLCYQCKLQNLGLTAAKR